MQSNAINKIVRLWRGENREHDVAESNPATKAIVRVRKPGTRVCKRERWLTMGRVGLDRSTRFARIYHSGRFLSQNAAVSSSSA